MPVKKYAHSLGFLGTGLVARTFLARMESLEDWLGPVYSPSRRATPRLVTALGAGFPVGSLEAMQRCQNLLVCATPEETEELLGRAVTEGVLDGVDTLALIEASADYLPAQDIVSSVKDLGFLTRLPVRREDTYLVEGSLRFRRFSQVLTKAPLRRLVFTRREARAMVESAIFMAEEFCQPLFEAVQRCVMLAGVSSDHARELASELLLQSVGSAHFAGRKRWTGILQSEDTEKLSRILEALQQENELLANLVFNYAQHGLAVMGKNTDWLPRAGSNAANNGGNTGDE
ncbi:MAG: hypothetical protein KIT83_10285 [Bryobacterales bacterium]|nr:hypothetical protein [Bryobacterales bacterium]